jgi:hypothetical protein
VTAHALGRLNPVVSDLYRRFMDSAHGVKLTRYALGSVVALLTSVVVFAL